MVMGYAGQLEDNPDLTPEERKKARVILRQSKKMRNLINDLNLASKLEYNMQPLNPKRINVIALVRQDRKSTRLNSSHVAISYAVFCLKKKKQQIQHHK